MQLQELLFIIEELETPLWPSTRTTPSRGRWWTTWQSQPSTDIFSRPRINMSLLAPCWDFAKPSPTRSTLVWKKLELWVSTSFSLIFLFIIAGILILFSSDTELFSIIIKLTGITTEYIGKFGAKTFHIKTFNVANRKSILPPLKRECWIPSLTGSCNSLSEYRCYHDCPVHLTCQCTPLLPSEPHQETSRPHTQPPSGACWRGCPCRISGRRPSRRRWDGGRPPPPGWSRPPWRPLSGRPSDPLTGGGGRLAQREIDFVQRPGMSWGENLPGEVACFLWKKIWIKWKKPNVCTPWPRSELARSSRKHFRHVS